MRVDDLPLALQEAISEHSSMKPQAVDSAEASWFWWTDCLLSLIFWSLTLWSVVVTSIINQSMWFIWFYDDNDIDYWLIWYAVDQKSRASGLCLPPFFGIIGRWSVVASDAWSVPVLLTQKLKVELGLEFLHVRTIALAVACQHVSNERANKWSSDCLIAAHRAQKLTAELHSRAVGHFDEIQDSRFKTRSFRWFHQSN